jgi:uncharacterized membrane protein
MDKELENWIKGISLAIGALFIISMLIFMFTPQGFLSSFRMVFGSIYVLFLPGFVISYIFFPQTKEFDSKSKNSGSVDWIERIALSFALSIAIVPLVVFYLNLIGLKISILSSTLVILGILAVSSGIVWWRNIR